VFNLQKTKVPKGRHPIAQYASAGFTIQKPPTFGGIFDQKL